MQDLAEAFDIVCRSYRLGPEDELRLLFQPEWNMDTGAYRLDTLDRIKIKFLVDPELNEEMVIRPDGMITLQGVGEVRAAGLTPNELADVIQQKFLEANVFTKERAQPGLTKLRIVTVHVLSFYEKLGKLVQSLTTLTSGSQTTVRVRPDGTIDLPLLEDRIMASGHTVEEIESTMLRLYKMKVLKNVRVSVSLASAKSRKVYILGQVGSPGAYDITQPITAIHALALAGGHLMESADLTSVILISKDIYGKPIGRRLDLKKIFDVGDMSQAILVKPYDVIYVPNTYIRDVRLFVDQYLSTIRDLIQFGSLR
ncbi:MAG: polysaccharide biosynthesis/export family protein [Pseudomonadota bacterium]